MAASDAPASSDHDSNSSIRPNGTGRKEDEEIPTVKLSLENSIHDLDVISVSTTSIRSKHYSSMPSLASGAITVVNVETAASQPLTQQHQHQHQQNTSSPLQRPAFISATVHKESEASLLGLGFKKVNGCLQVSSIRSDCLLSDAPFQVGDKLISINNIDCSQMSLSKVAKLLKTTTGLLTDVAEDSEGDPKLVQSMIVKVTPTSKIGLGLSRDVCPTHVSISSICFLLTKSTRSHSLYILCINGKDCRCLPAQEAADMITKATSTLSIVAKKGMDNAAVLLLTASPTSS